VLPARYGRGIGRDNADAAALLNDYRKSVSR
jgi:hypothetical protein